MFNSRQLYEFFFLIIWFCNKVGKNNSGMVWCIIFVWCQYFYFVTKHSIVLFFKSSSVMSKIPFMFIYKTNWILIFWSGLNKIMMLKCIWFNLVQKVKKSHFHFVFFLMNYSNGLKILSYLKFICSLYEWCKCSPEISEQTCS